MHAALVSRLGLDGELRRALKRDELELRYQPVIELRTGAINGFESLLRWRHPARGLLAAAEFMAVAEETGLIVEMGRWALAQACAQLDAWGRDQARGMPLGMGVNVSLRELIDRGFAGAVEAAVARMRRPARLVLEVSEAGSQPTGADTVDALRRMRELGALVALDDFGLGHASLLHVKRLPLDFIKIAQPFVDAVDAGGTDRSGLLAGIVSLGAHLGVTTVAEAIERPEQRAHLLALGCDHGQGHLLGAPMDARTAGELLAAHFSARVPIR